MSLNGYSHSHPQLRELLSLFPYDSARPAQKGALASLARMFTDDNHFSIIEAPTGAGKTALAVATARYASTLNSEEFDPGAYILTPHNNLAEQMISDFGGLGLASIRGRRHYEAKCAGAYEHAKSKFAESPIGVTNYAYFLHARHLPERQALILDEGHNLERVLLDMAGFRVTPQICRAIGIDSPPRFGIPEHGQIVDWLGAVVLPALWKHVKHCMESGVRREWEDLTDRVAGYMDMDDHSQWLAWSDDEGALTVKPLSVTAQARDLFARARFVLILSATIFDFRTFRRVLGMPDEAVTFSAPSDFPLRNRPIIYIPVGDMAAQKMNHTIPNMCAEIERILNEFSGSKGVIHTHSYSINQRVSQYLAAKYGHRIIIHGQNPQDREQAIRLHCATDGPSVLVSPSLAEGVDLKGDLARFQIVCKVPYPRLDAYTGHVPCDAEVLSVLALLSVEVLDVEQGGHGEREAIRTLSTVVIEDPNQEGAAWSSVLKAARKMVTDRSGLDLASVRRQLLEDGIALRAAPSYRRDIERLRAHTAAALRSLKDLSQITLNGKPVHIERGAVKELESAADRDSHLVTGHPGAGKSGALHDLAEILHSKGDVVCLAADKLDITSLPALRSELGLEHEIADILANWPGSRPSYLLIDALDAARGTRAADALRELIREIVGLGSRWHVIACIRKFDLRYSRALQDLFPKTGKSAVAPEFEDSDFPFVRYVNVPLLSEDELFQLESKAPVLYELYRNASKELRQLLHVPFNLRLAATLLENGMRSEDFAPIQTQIDLLNRYWERRVVDSNGGDDREAVLRKVLAEMVSKRRLQVDREAAVIPGLSAALDQLLSRHVLTEWKPSPTAAPDRRSLAFEHNFLFDFALMKLHLPERNGDLVQKLESDQDAIIVLRPSLALRAQELWSKEPATFWELAMVFSGAVKLSLLAQMTPMITVAENAREIESLKPLIDALDSSSPQDTQAGRKAMRHLVLQR
jgi:hypothetical protein